MKQILFRIWITFSVLFVILAGGFVIYRNFISYSDYVQHVSRHDLGQDFLFSRGYSLGSAIDKCANECRTRTPQVEECKTWHLGGMAIGEKCGSCILQCNSEIWMLFEYENRDMFFRSYAIDIIHRMKNYLFLVAITPILILFLGIIAIRQFDWIVRKR